MAYRLELESVTLAIALSVAQNAAAQTVTYSDSSTADKLQSAVGLGVGDGDLSLRAGVTMIGQDGVTRVLPRVTSQWSGLGFLDVDTVLAYDDLNSAGGSFEPTMDTSVLLSSGFAFVDRIEGNVRRSGAASDETLKLDFAPVDTRFSVLGGDPFGIDAGIVLHADGDARRASSNIASSWGVGPAIGVKTVLNFDDGGAGVPSVPAVDTSFVYDSPVAVVDRLEAAVQRSSTGGIRQSLGLRFSELPRGDAYDSSFRISSRAIVEEMLQPDGAETLSMGVEAKLTNLLSPLLGGSSALSFRIDRALAEVEARTSTLAYDHSWSPGGASLGLNLKLLRRLDDVEPSMGVTWSAKF